MALAFLVVLLLISPAAYVAKTHTVGGASGWDTGVNYDNWANGRTITVGDTIVFTYGPDHSVIQVNEADYQSCNSDNAINIAFNPSPTRISLKTPGTRYFICPTSNHCSRGMKLSVNVKPKRPS